jgi:molecular chaperone DnaK (HSP70)
VAVYDLGGAPSTFALLELSGGVFQVLSTNGDTQLGRDDMDAAIAKSFGDAGGSRDGQAVSRTSRGGSPVASSDLESICRPIVERARKLCLRR